MEVFLGLTLGFDVPAGAVVLMALASHAVAVSADNYAIDFVRTSASLHCAFAGLVAVLHGIPFSWVAQKNQL